MTASTRRLLEQALQLEASERARLAAELLASLDDEQENVHAAWAAEIQGRAADARANPEADLDWREALTEIERDVLRANAITR